VVFANKHEDAISRSDSPGSRKGHAEHRSSATEATKLFGDRLARRRRRDGAQAFTGTARENDNPGFPDTDHDATPFC
jgi:hypothetical protein